jgi:hypothetical protein
MYMHPDVPDEETARIFWNWFQPMQWPRFNLHNLGPDTIRDNLLFAFDILRIDTIPFMGGSVLFEIRLQDIPQQMLPSKASTPGTI